MRAQDVMTTEVVTVTPETSVQDLARLMSERGISGVPVLEGDRLVGIISEGDLLHRAETGTERRTARRRWRWFDDSPAEAAREYVKAHGRKVGEIMLRAGRLVGIISRANLVRALAAAGGAPAAAGESDDRAIHARLLAELNGRE